MEYRRLGKSGLLVSELSFGSWVTFGNQIGEDISTQLMKTAYDAGVNFFDNAEVYAGGKSEIVMGKILKEMNWDRSTYVVSSKVFWGGSLPNQKGLMRKHIIEACHAALKRFQLEYLDLFFCHRPDVNTPMEEVVWSMHNLIQQGKILYWGTSEWSAQEITHAIMVAEKHHLIGPVMEQPQYNMLYREKMEKNYIPLFTHFGMGTTIWSPLASGVLTGKYLSNNPSDARANLPELSWIKEKNVDNPEFKSKVEGVAMLAKEIGVPMSQLAIAWCLKNKNVSTVILGASKVEQLTENLKSSSLLPLLTDDVMNRLDEILDNKPKIVQF